MNHKIFPKRWVLIRGLTRSHFHWFEFKNILKAELQLVSVETPELPGNGYLFNQTTPIDLSSAVDYLKKQISDTDQPVGLIGISLGGVIATKWALQYPEQISHLVIINSSFPISPFYHRLIPKNYLKILGLALFGDDQKTENFILKATSNSENWKNKLDLCVQFQKNYPIQLSNLMAQLKLAGEDKFTIRPNCPTLILASKNDRLVNYKCSLNIAQMWGLQTEIHPTAGHDLPLDDSLWIIEKIRSAFKY